MKNKILALLFLTCLTSNAQITNRLIVTQNVDSGINPPNIMYTVPPNDNRIYQTNRNNLLLTTSQITGLATYITDIGNINYKPLTYAPTSTEITDALGYTPFNPSGLANQYIAGNGTYVNFPNLFSGNYNDLTNRPTLFSGSYTDLTNKPLLSAVATSGNYNDLTAKPDLSVYYLASNPNGYISSVSWVSITGKPSFATVATTGSYNDLTNQPTIPTNTNQLVNGAGFITGVNATQINTALGYTPYNSTNPNGYVDQAGTRNSISVTGNGSYNPTTGVITVNSSIPAKVFNNNVARTLNSNFTISTTRDANVNYSVNLSVTNPLLLGSSTASAFLEYSTNGGTTWITVSEVSNASSVALTVTIAITLPNTFALSGNIPANALVRLRTTTTGTASASYVRGQEVLF